MTILLGELYSCCLKKEQYTFYHERAAALVKFREGGNHGFASMASAWQTTLTWKCEYEAGVGLANDFNVEMRIRGFSGAADAGSPAADVDMVNAAPK